MTDNEIVKALECCSEEDKCKECPYYNEENFKCLNYKFFKDLLDLINRIQAENENLKEKNSNLTSDLTSLQNDLTSAKEESEAWRDGYIDQKQEIANLEQKLNEKSICLKELLITLKEIKAEAYKEYIEKAKSELKNISKFDFHGTYYYLVGEAFFDNLLKEMGVDGKEGET